MDTVNLKRPIVMSLNRSWDEFIDLKVKALRGKIEDTDTASVSLRVYAAVTADAGSMIGVGKWTKEAQAYYTSPLSTRDDKSIDMTSFYEGTLMWIPLANVDSMETENVAS